MNVTLALPIPKEEQRFDPKTGQLRTLENKDAAKHISRLDEAVALRVVSDKEEATAAMELLKAFSKKYPDFSTIKQGAFDDGSVWMTASKGKRDNADEVIKAFGL